MIKKTITLLIVFLCSNFIYGQTTPPAPYGPLPAKAQLRWHEIEMYAMVCYGLNTYTDKEWGYGDVDPALFNPTAFDAGQIASTLKEAGFKGLLFVAKHHDGFCLWPTLSTKYSVAASPWMNGKGDMVKSFETAARKNGLSFGVYNSPWDRNSALYGKSSYLSVYRKQLEELHTNYGSLFISWYDGANGGDGYYGGARESREIDRTNYYEWDKNWGIVQKLQPNAVIFSDLGPDVRWVGNESGFADETSWATFTPKGGKDINKPALGDSRYQEAPGGNRDGKFWIPAECDVPLRPGWYYHASQDDKVKSPYELFDIYFKSVGRGAALDLGVAPDKRGILNENDVAALKGFGKLLKETFSTNLLAKAVIKASNIRGNNKTKYGPENLLDNNKSTYWSTDDKITTPQFTIEINKTERFNIIKLREEISLGQRVESFAVDIWKNNSWREITKGTSIGAQRLIRLPYFITADRIRVRILSSPVCPVLSEFGIFAEPDSSLFHIAKTTKNQLDGSKKDWQIISAPGEFNTAALIDDKATIWQGPFNSTNIPGNAIVIDMMKQREISGVLFTPSAEAFSKGMVDKYQVSFSTDGINWKDQLAGEFGNIRTNPIQQLISLPHRTITRFIKFTPLHLTDDSNFIRIAELGVY
jgi:alpha-L-fucosidase